MSLYFYFGLGLFLLAQAYWIFTKLRQTETKETKERLKTGLSMGDFQWERIKQMCLVYFLSCVFTIYICIRFDGNFCPVFLVVSMTSLLTHTVAHSTRPFFRTKTNYQPLKKFLSLAVS